MTHVPRSERRLIGDKIGLSARKLTAPTVVPRSGRHNAQQIFGVRDAVAWVERLKEATEDALAKKGTGEQE